VPAAALREDDEGGAASPLSDADEPAQLSPITLAAGGGAGAFAVGPGGGTLDEEALAAGVGPPPPPFDSWVSFLTAAYMPIPAAAGHGVAAPTAGGGQPAQVPARSSLQEEFASALAREMPGGVELDDEALAALGAMAAGGAASAVGLGAFSGLQGLGLSAGRGGGGGVAAHAGTVLMLADVLGRASHVSAVLQAARARAAQGGTGGVSRAAARAGPAGVTDTRPARRGRGRGASAVSSEDEGEHHYGGAAWAGAHIAGSRPRNASDYSVASGGGWDGDLAGLAGAHAAAGYEDALHVMQLHEQASSAASSNAGALGSGARHGSGRVTAEVRRSRGATAALTAAPAPDSARHSHTGRAVAHTGGGVGASGALPPIAEGGAVAAAAPARPVGSLPRVPERAAADALLTAYGYGYRLVPAPAPPTTDSARTVGGGGLEGSPANVQPRAAPAQPTQAAAGAASPDNARTQAMPAAGGAHMAALRHSVRRHTFTDLLAYEDVVAAKQASLALRRRLRALVAGGNPHAVATALQEQAPYTLAYPPHAAFISALLHCQGVVDAVARGDVGTALAIARAELAPFLAQHDDAERARQATALPVTRAVAAAATGGASGQKADAGGSSDDELLPVTEAVARAAALQAQHVADADADVLAKLLPLLRAVMGLLAYADPAASPLAYLLHPAARDAVADVVNAAVVEHALAAAASCRLAEATRELAHPPPAPPAAAAGEAAAAGGGAAGVGAKRGRSRAGTSGDNDSEAGGGHTAVRRRLDAESRGAGREAGGDAMGGSSARRRGLRELGAGSAAAPSPGGRQSMSSFLTSLGSLQRLLLGINPLAGLVGAGGLIRDDSEDEEAARHGPRGSGGGLAYDDDDDDDDDRVRRAGLRRPGSRGLGGRPRGATEPQLTMSASGVGAALPRRGRSARGHDADAGSEAGGDDDGSISIGRSSSGGADAYDRLLRSFFDARHDDGDSSTSSESARSGRGAGGGGGTPAGSRELWGEPAYVPASWPSMPAPPPPVTGANRVPTRVVPAAPPTPRRPRSDSPTTRTRRSRIAEALRDLLGRGRGRGAQAPGTGGATPARDTAEAARSTPAEVSSSGDRVGRATSAAPAGTASGGASGHAMHALQLVMGGSGEVPGTEAGADWCHDDAAASRPSPAPGATAAAAPQPEAGPGNIAPPSALPAGAAAAVQYVFPPSFFYGAEGAAVPSSVLERLARMAAGVRLVDAAARRLHQEEQPRAGHGSGAAAAGSSLAAALRHARTAAAGVAGPGGAAPSTASGAEAAGSAAGAWAFWHELSDLASAASGASPQ
jgi:hypothetical protein